MKKLLVVMLVLAMTSIASASIEFSVSATTVDEGGSIDITISAPETQAQGLYILGIVSGDASFDMSAAVIDYAGIPSSCDLTDDADTAAMLGIQNPWVGASLTDTVDPIVDPLGTLVHGIKLVAGAAGDVVVQLFDGGDGTPYNSITITVGSVVPEPITIGLLGLGGLFLRRRK